MVMWNWRNQNSAVGDRQSMNKISRGGDESEEQESNEFIQRKEERIEQGLNSLI